MFTNQNAHYAPKRTENAERGSYMAELDKWLEEAVFEPIERAVTSGDAKRAAPRL